MDFKIGYSVKPKEINSQNQVVFEEWTTTGEPRFIEVTPSQSECEAYGFVFSNSFCWIIENYTDFFYAPSENLSLIQTSPSNITHPITQDSVIIGRNNQLRFENSNDLIVGTLNQIDSEVDNTILAGKLGLATANNSIVLGGNADDDDLGERQNITVIFGTATTNNTTSDSYLNNTVGSYFEVPEDTILAFQSETVAVRTGGTGAGSIGDFKAFIETGAVINNAGVLTIDSSRNTIANVGTTTGWIPTSNISGTNFVQQVKGANNRDIKWATTIRFTQLKM
tara:strand:- start:1427 stop:2269 length:843 start_codon:yes stop_codon:yes gene_type:complete